MAFVANRANGLAARREWRTQLVGQRLGSGRPIRVVTAGLFEQCTQTRHVRLATAAGITMSSSVKP
jgi:hypothetical protein